MSIRSDLTAYEQAYLALGPKCTIAAFESPPAGRPVNPADRAETAHLSVAHVSQRLRRIQDTLGVYCLRVLLYHHLVDAGQRYAHFKRWYRHTYETSPSGKASSFRTDLRAAEVVWYA